MIIDAHCHAGIGDGLTGPWDTRASLEKYQRWAIDAGIDKTVLLPAFHSDYQAANTELAKIISISAGRYYGFAFVDPVRDRGRIYTMIRTAVQCYHFSGIKVHRHNSRMTREICDVAKAFSLPVIYDVAGEISVCELLAQEYPEVNFIIPHMGSFADDWRAQLAMIDHLVRHNNIYTDTSGVRRFDLLEQAIQRAGPEKILFGSDGPWLHPGVELEKIYLLGLSEKDEKKILAENFLHLISQIKRSVKLQVLAHRNEDAPSIPKLGNEFHDPWSLD